MLIDELSTLATKRDNDLFQDDLDSRRGELEDLLHGRRVLVVGGAGSIGAATVHVLSGFNLQALHVVDQNENGLAELVRDMRSRPGRPQIGDFHTLPLDFGSPWMERFLSEQAPYDYVLNFAALKHVRSEKDVYSLLQMLDTNVLKTARLLEWLEAKGGTQRYFCVSTDKAANPVNLMGASKRLMEHVIFSPEAATGSPAHRTSARFANVAFSDGSLLHSFLLRLQKRQPLAVPAGTRRYFISVHEAGRLCVLAALCAPDRHSLIPRFDPDRDLHELAPIAHAVLRHHGYEPAVYDCEDEARSRVASDIQRGRYPLLMTPLDTSGEKSYEEFLGTKEVAAELGFRDLLGVQYRPVNSGVADLLKMIRGLYQQPISAVTKGDIVAGLSHVVTELRHCETGKTLDARM